MRNDIYNLVNELGNMFYEDGGYRSFPIDVVEMPKGYEVYAEIPGMHKEDIQISFENGDLTIIANPKKDKDKRYVIHERSQMKLKRTISFGDINEDELSAKYENGVLLVSITTKMPEEKKAKSISIE